MAVVTSSDLLTTWRALPGNSSRPGWRSINLIQTANCWIKAAKHSPSNEEALIVSFPGIKIAEALKLPQGQGFRMEPVALDGEGLRHWLAIIRQPAGGLELFALVIADACELLCALDCTPDILYQKLLGRVRGWQDFMRKGHEGLGPEGELGLVGELHILKCLLEYGVSPVHAVDGWEGPLRGVHDFKFGSGGVEVKSTLSTETFKVHIMSMEQLDDSLSSPLFLCGLRFLVDDHGKTLSEHVAEVRDFLCFDPGLQREFNHLLYEASYLDMHAGNYTRRFSCVEDRVYPVDKDFPRVVSSSVPGAVSHLSYDLDLSMVDSCRYRVSELAHMLEGL